MPATRVLYLVPQLLGAPNGIGRYCALVARALKSGGAECTVVSLHDPVRGADGGHDGAGGSRGIFAGLALRRALETRPDVVVLGHPGFCTVGAALASLTAAKLMVFVYGVDIWSPLQRTRRWALQRADRVVAISDFTARKATSVNGVSARKMRVLFNCLDPDLVHHHGACGSKTDAPPSLLTVARISKAENFKGHDVVLRAMPKLLKRFPDLVYDVVGDGDARPELERLARNLGVADAVRFRGIVSDRQLSALYESASVMVMPSAREGFGFVFLEAMAHGTPAIGGNVDAAPEVIADGETGFVVDPQSVEAVGAAIERVLGDAALRERMGLAAATRARTHFGFERFRTQLLEHLSEVMAS